MSWYMAVLVRGAHVGGVLDEERLGDLLYRLIQADGAQDAYTRAVALGRESGGDEYADEDGVSVTFEYLGLADLMEIPGGQIGDGSEVYSRLIPRRPSEMVAPKEELTVFEPASEETSDEDEDEDENENADKNGRGSGGGPIQPGG